MERLNWHIAQELSRYAEVRVVGPAGSAALAPANVCIDEVKATKLGAFIGRGLLAGLRISRSWRPDVVLAGSGITAPIAVFAAKACGARSAVYTHGLDLAVDHLAYRWIWLRFIARSDTVLVNSSATRTLALAAGVRADCIHLVHPGVELPAKAGGNLDGRAFRQKHNLGDGKILLSVGRLTHRKGMREFVSGALPRIASRFPECKLVVVGDVPTHALAATGQSISSIREAATRAGVSSNVVFVGTISDRQELAQAYLSADLHVFPVRELPNDPEGFGMVAIEAAAHGVSTVAYRTGGVPDAVSEGQSGSLVEPGDEIAFARAVVALLERPLPTEKALAFAQDFSWDRIGRRLAAVLNVVNLDSQFRMRR